MVFDNGQLEELIESLEKSKNYLSKKSKSEASYEKLIPLLDRKIEFLRKNKKLWVKLVSTSSSLVLKLKAASEANLRLRSLYNFEAVSPFKNISEIANNCHTIVAIFQSDQIVTQHHRKFIDLVRKKNIDFLILVVKSNSHNSNQTITEYLESQDNLKCSYFSLPINDFFNLEDKQNIEYYQRILIEHATALQDKFIQDNYRNISRDIECFFDAQNIITWRNIRQIKEHYLQEREVHNYQQQVLTKTFNKINQEKQSTILQIKQKINQSKSEYLNPFLPNSWIFELQQIIEESRVKLIKEKDNTYLYPIIQKSSKPNKQGFFLEVPEHHDSLQSESFHSYILNLYQQQIIETLKSQWTKINYVYADGGLNMFVSQANHTIKTISILEPAQIEFPKITLDLENFPELSLSDIVDSYCLQASTKLIFDYNYTQSSWFKLLMSALIGTTIYLITKVYFGSGKYIGFFILFVQIINIFTGQSAKKTKLKSHKKELQRILNSKYQILARLVVEQMTQTLIVSLDKKNREYQIQINAIAQLAQEKLDQIQQDINQHQLRKNQLESDRIKIKTWLN
ncbi:MAG: hypothetical protein ACFCAD_21660 [Pleurocapsa sp.]